MSTIIAIKEGKKRTFNLVEWNLLGKNKEGWKEAPSQQVVNEKAPLQTGNKVAPVITKVENEAELKKLQETQNEIKKETETPPPPIEEVVDEVKVAEFVTACEGITKGQIKDYFDKSNVPYDNSNKLSELILVLGTHLNYDISKLAENF